MANIVTDSGFWIALFNERDDYHTEAQVVEHDLRFHTILLPWPTLYETFNTRMARRPADVGRFNAFLTSPSTALLNDSTYRDASLSFVLKAQKRPLSLADHVVRSMLADPSLLVEAFVGFNPGDFSDVCDSRGIEMLYR